MYIKLENEKAKCKDLENLHIQNRQQILEMDANLKQFKAIYQQDLIKSKFHLNNNEYKVKFYFTK